MSRQSDLFKIPVCNSFKAKRFYTQLCYEVDIHEIFEGESFTAKELKLGLSLLVDTNFNRQYTLKERINKASINETIGKFDSTINAFFID